MDTTITERTSVEYELEINASSDTLEPRITQALRKLRGSVNMKGFRPGKVPLSLVKKMYGKQVALEVIESAIQETYESEIVDSGAYQVLGPPTISTIDYEPFGDLRAVVEFGVRPEVDLADFPAHEVVRLSHEVEDSDIEEELTHMRESRAELVPHDEAAGEADVVFVDMQKLDLETGVPILGDSERLESVPVYLGNEHTVEELKTALTGRRVDDVTQVVLPAPENQPDEAEPVGPRRFQITVREIKRRELPELDDEFAQEISNGEVETMDALRDEIRTHLQAQWDRRLREDFEDRLTKKTLELHPFDVPASAVEMYLDAFVSDVKRKNEGDLPENFDEAAFREQNRQGAVDLVRWLVIRDRFVDETGVEVTDDDLNEAFTELGGRQELSGDMMRQLLAAYNPDGVDQIERQVLNKKVYDALAERYAVVERTYAEEYEQDDEQDGA